MSSLTRLNLGYSKSSIVGYMCTFYCSIPIERQQLWSGMDEQLLEECPGFPLQTLHSFWKAFTTGLALFPPKGREPFAHLKLTTGKQDNIVSPSLSRLLWCLVGFRNKAAVLTSRSSDTLTHVNCDVILRCQLPPVSRLNNITHSSSLWQPNLTYCNSTASHSFNNCHIYGK